MEKVIAAFDARRQFGRVLNDVIAKGDKFVVERHGEPVAAVAPMEVYEQWKRQREVFFDTGQEVAERVNLPEAEATALAIDAVERVRSANGG